MKKALMTFSVVVLLSMGGLALVSAQNQQPTPQKDTVNMDTYAKPEKYYSTEDEKQSKKSGGTTVAIVVVAVVIVAGAGYLLVRKKKK